MAAYVFKVTPDTLYELCHSIKLASMDLQTSAQNIRSLLSVLDSSIDGDAISAHIHSEIDSIQDCERLSEDLITLSNDLATMSESYEKAVENTASEISEAFQEDRSP